MAPTGYSFLTDAEKATWNEYTNLRQLTNWPGFDAAQTHRKLDSRNWLLKQRKAIEAAAKADGRNGWDKNHRKARYDFLAPANLNVGAPVHRVRLPAPGVCTDTEKVYIEEREVYLTFGSTSDDQKARKLANVNWLVERRKQLYRLMHAKGGEYAGRQKRYDALCVATHHGSAYEAWDDSHNKWGVPTKPESPALSARRQCVNHALGFVGVVENPAGSNKGHPHPSDWQDRLLGADGYAWCACFAACMAWDVGVQGAATAGVWNNIEMAKRGQGMYRGFTTDRSLVHTGDHVAIGCSTCHQEIVRNPPVASGVDTVGGNTSPGNSGSQFNGGCVGTHHRSNEEVVGFMLVRF
jgi:hypothetical protein